MSKKDNIKSLGKNKKTRMNIIIIGAIIFVLVGAAAFLFLGNEGESGPQSTQSAANVSGAGQDFDRVPGTSNSNEFNDLVDESNRQQTQDSLEQNRSFVPTLTSQRNEEEDFIQSNNDFNTNDNQQPVQSSNQIYYVLMPSAQEIEAARQRRQDAIDEQQAEYERKANSIRDENENTLNAENQAIESYKDTFAQRMNHYLNPTAKTTQSVAVSGGADVFGYNDNAQNNNNNSSNNDSSSSGQGQESKSSRSEIIADAGSVLPAVLVKAVNTDYGQPIVARVVAGKFKGAIVTGEVGLVYDRAVLAFNNLSLGQGRGTISINGYAVNRETAEYGMAADVDHHTLRNVGYVFAASFLRGLGQAAQRQNTATGVSGDGAVTVQGELSDSDLAVSALGDVGDTFAQRLQRQGVRPPTVRIPSQESIGILIVEDVTR